MTTEIAFYYGLGAGLLIWSLSSLVKNSLRYFHNRKQTVITEKQWVEGKLLTIETTFKDLKQDFDKYKLLRDQMTDYFLQRCTIEQLYILWKLIDKCCEMEAMRMAGFSLKSRILRNFINSKIHD